LFTSFLDWLIDGGSPRGSEAREAVDGREPGHGGTGGNHGDGLPQFAASRSRPVPQIHPEVEDAEEDDRAAYVGDGLRGEPDEFFQCPFTVLSFLACEPHVRRTAGSGCAAESRRL